MERFKALEAENAQARQKIADLEAELKAVKDEQAARFDRIEQLLAGLEKRSDDASAHEHVRDKPTATVDQQGAHDAVGAKYGQAIAEREDSREGMDTSDARHHGWRRATSSENLGLANTVAGAADTVAQFAMHATPEGIVSLGLTALGVAVTLRARAEKNAEKKGRGTP
jgi:septal ring factor EnvC (AmiA/AmiB activator)